MNDFIFKVAGTCLLWGKWGDCSEECGPGTRSRMRVCSDAPIANSSVIADIQPGETLTVGGVTIQAEEEIQTCDVKQCDSTGMGF